MKQQKNNLNKVWKKRLEMRAEANKLRAEGSKLYAEGRKLMAEGNKLWAEGDKLYVEGRKLWAEANKLKAEGGLLFINAVIKVYGNIELEFKNWDEDKKDYDCHLETGEVFKP